MFGFIMENEISKYLSEWVKDARKKTGMSQEKFAHELGYSGKASVSAIENGINMPSFETVVNISRLADVAMPYQNPNSTIADIGSLQTWSSSDPLPDDEYIYAPFYKDIELAAGDGSLLETDHNGFKLPFARSTLHRLGVSQSNVVCVSVAGNSMEPIIPDGSTIAIDTSNKNIRDGKTYAIRQGDLLRVKRLYRLPNNQIRINSYNIEEHPDEIISPDNLDIIGKVFCWSVLDF